MPIIDKITSDDTRIVPKPKKAKVKLHAKHATKHLYTILNHPFVIQNTYTQQNTPQDEFPRKQEKNRQQTRNKN